MSPVSNMLKTCSKVVYFVQLVSAKYVTSGPHTASPPPQMCVCVQASSSSQNHSVSQISLVHTLLALLHRCVCPGQQQPESQHGPNISCLLVLHGI